MAEDQELVTVLNAVRFLRMAVIEMHRMANDEPDLGDRLRVLVDKCEAEFEDLVEQFQLPRALEE